MKAQSAAMVFELAQPTILGGTVDNRYPFATKAFMKLLAPLPARVIIDGSPYSLGSSDQLDIPVNFDAGELSQFLAKVAHGYAISRRGLDSCQEYFLPPIILGNPEGAMTYVGGNSCPLVGPVLPGGGLHALLDRVNNGFLTVYLQLFRDAGDPPPIYEVVVGRLRDAS